MQKTATVTSASYSHSFDGKYGTMHVHEIHFDNGDSGEYNNKYDNQNKFVEGRQATYTIEPNGEHPPRIKPVNEQYAGTTGIAGSGPARQKPNGKSNTWYGSEEHLKMERFRNKAIIMQSSMERAVSISIHNGVMDNRKVFIDDILALSDKIYEHIINRSK